MKKIKKLSDTFGDILLSPQMYWPDYIKHMCKLML